MSVYIDRRYLLLVSSRLERFAQKKDDLFNFRCPFCGDSKKNKLKARGYIFRKNNDYFYTCHNCHVSTTFSKFLKHVDSNSHGQYILDRYADGENGHSNYTKPTFDFSGPKPSQVFSGKEDGIPAEQERGSSSNIRNCSFDGLVSIKDLPDEHHARQYIIERAIPEAFWGEIFHTNKYKEFLDTNFPDHGNENVPNDERIVLFYTNEKGDITNVSGRALGQNRIRYCTVKVGEEKKLFGMHRMRLDSRVYVVEGQFDSFFIPNCVASGDSNLGGVVDHLATDNITLVYDNEPRNPEIVKQIERSISKGYSVCLFPESIPGKDINEMIALGISAEEINIIIDDNTFNGLTAKLKFIEWRKC
jgi:transcription elongation factor Elf1